MEIDNKTEEIKRERMSEGKFSLLLLSFVFLYVCSVFCVSVNVRPINVANSSSYEIYRNKLKLNSVQHADHLI